jgi:hypothetical protein
VTEERELGVQGGEAPGAVAVALRIAREDPRRLVQPGDRGDQVQVEEDVAEHERAVALTPERDVPV